jgi:ATP-dependent helicase/nuclease subunit A
MVDGVLIEGVVDLAFLDNGRWHIVDFKTDRDIAPRAIERYTLQVGLYAGAISRATNTPASAYLLRI